MLHNASSVQTDTHTCFRCTVIFKKKKKTFASNDKTFLFVLHSIVTVSKNEHTEWRIKWHSLCCIQFIHCDEQMVVDLLTHGEKLLLVLTTFNNAFFQSFIIAYGEYIFEKYMRLCYINFSPGRLRRTLWALTCPSYVFMYNLVANFWFNEKFIRSGSMLPQKFMGFCRVNLLWTFDFAIIIQISDRILFAFFCPKNFCTCKFLLSKFAN